MAVTVEVDRYVVVVVLVMRRWMYVRVVRIVGRSKAVRVRVRVTVVGGYSLMKLRHAARIWRGLYFRWRYQGSGSPSLRASVMVEVGGAVTVVVVVVVLSWDQHI